jgi:hypothetical protein
VRDQGASFGAEVADARRHNDAAILVVTATLAVLLAATAHQLASALSVIEMGTLPGEEPPGATLAVLSGLMAMLAGALLVNVVQRASALMRGVLAGLAPAGAAFITARFYAFDPYYLPTPRRFSEAGVVSPEWVFLLVVAGLGAGIATWRWPHLGSRLTGIVLFAGAWTTLLIGAGH